MVLRARWVDPLRAEAATNRTIVRNSALAMVGTVIQSVVRFASNAIVGRLGGPVTLGLVASGIATAQLLSLCWPTSTGAAASKFVSRARGKADDEELHAVAAHLAKRTVQSTLALVLLSLPIWMIVDDGRASTWAAVAVLVAGYSGYSFTRGFLYGLGRTARATAWDVVTGVIALSGVLTVLALGVRGLDVLLPIGFAYLGYTATNWPWSANGRPPGALRSELDHFVGLGVLGTLASAGFLQLSMIAARLVSNDHRTGDYAAALTLATPGALVGASLSLVLFPSMSQTWGRGDLDGFNRKTDQAMRLLVLILVPLFGGLALCSQLLVLLVWGRAFSEAPTVLPILLTAVLATSLGIAATNALTTQAKRGMVTSTVLSLTGMLAGVSAWALLAPNHGIQGVAWGYLVGTCFIGGLPIVVVWRAGRHPWGGLMTRCALGLAVLACALVFQHHYQAPTWSEPLSAVAFVLAWLALLLPVCRTAVTPMLAAMGIARSGTQER